jgi:uncharacterized protein (TIGR02265 family)
MTMASLESAAVLPHVASIARSTPAVSPPATPPAPRPSPALTPAPSADVLRMMTGKVKGTLLIARMKFLRSRGEAEAERVLKRMSSDDQAVLRQTLLPSSWYPAGTLLRLEMTAAAILAQGDRRELFLEMGRFTAATNLAPAGMQRPFVREDDPHFILENLPRLYASQHSSGHRTHERTGATSAVIRHFEAEQADADDCLTTAGWLQRAVEISGGHGAQVDETQCRCRGAPHCEFRVTWR